MLRNRLGGLLIVGACLLPGSAHATSPDDLSLARQAVVELDWRQVQRRYEPIRASASVGDAAWLESTYCLALAQHHVQPPDATTIGSARSLYQEVIDRAPQSRWAARAMLNIGRIEELRDYPTDVVDLDAARSHYERVVALFPKDPIAGEATLRAAATLVMAYDAPEYAKVRQGVALLERWLQQYPDEPLASVMWQYAGDSYFRPLADYANALRCYEEVDRLGWVDRGNQGPWYWRCALLAERELNLPDVAAKYYAKIIVETPNSGKAYEAMEALRRMGRPVPSSPMFERLEPTTQEARP